MKIWIDIKNSHEPAFFSTIMKALPEHKFYLTSRDWAEISALLRSYSLDHTCIGGRTQGSMARRVAGYWWRVARLAWNVPKFDISICHHSGHCIHATKFRRRKNITFTDNDINIGANKMLFRFIRYLITPKAIPIETLVEQNAKREAIHQFNGYKEDLYIADYEPDPDFLDKLPFREFVTVRPENLQAIYLQKDPETIVPALLNRLEEEDRNVLLLPRHESDREYAKGHANIHIPEEALNGLDTCYYSQAILTGAGTFSREAACMGTPAVSFFPGERILSVDKKMFEDGWVFHSRDPDSIVDHVLSSSKRTVDLSRSKRVQGEAFGILQKIIAGEEAG